MKKLFKALKDSKNLTSKKISSSIIAILDALLTMLPDGSSNSDSNESLDPEGKYFHDVLKKFKKKDCQNVTKLIKMSEFIFDNVSDDDTELMDVFQMCACCIAIICGYSKKEVRAQIYIDISKSESLDFQLIIDSAKLRIEDAKSIAPRVNAGIKALVDVINSVE